MVAGLVPGIPEGIVDGVTIIIAVVSVVAAGLILAGHLRNRRHIRAAERARNPAQTGAAVAPAGTTAPPAGAHAEVPPQRSGSQTVLPFGALSSAPENTVIPCEFLVLYVDFPQDKPVQLAFLELSLRAQNLDRGRGKIYHSFVDRGRRRGTRYAVANGVEPGTLDETEVEEVYSVALFMGWPNCDDLDPVFSEMLGVARYLARHHQGQVVDEHGASVGDDDSNTVLYYRDQIRGLMHREVN